MEVIIDKYHEWNKFYEWAVENSGRLNSNCTYRFLSVYYHTLNRIIHSAHYILIGLRNIFFCVTYVILNLAKSINPLDIKLYYTLYYY